MVGTAPAKARRACPRRNGDLRPQRRHRARQALRGFRQRDGGEGGHDEDRGENREDQPSRFGSVLHEYSRCRRADTEAKRRRDTVEQRAQSGSVARLQIHAALIAFLVTDCCDGHPELCSLAGLIPAPDCGCAPVPSNKKRGK